MRSVSQSPLGRRSCWSTFTRQWEADLYVLHVYSAPAYAANPHYVYAVQGIDWQRRQLEDKLLDWVSQLQKQHARTFALFEDGESPAREIQRAASNLHADLIVVSTHDRAWLAKYLFYSDADEIARRAAAPVLVFRAKQDAERPGLQGRRACPGEMETRCASSEPASHPPLNKK